jgi:hypothetical protein
MKKLLLVGFFIAVAIFLLTASRDVRSVLGWCLSGYLIVRALPGIGRDLQRFRALFSGRRISLRRSKVDTL